MNQAFETMRPQMVQSSVVLHKDFQPFVQNLGSAIDEDEDYEKQYIANDMFSKLKYDDIRRVHKDQTVLPVGEADFAKVSTYGSVEEYRKVRAAQNMSAMDKERSERILREEEAQKQEQFNKRWNKMQQDTQRHEQNNAAVMSSFMLLGDGSGSGQGQGQGQGPNVARKTSSSGGYVNKSRMSCIR
jgi:hypothetical protein